MSRFAYVIFPPVVATDSGSDEGQVTVGRNVKGNSVKVNLTVAPVGR